jgi:hypothetical protein
MWGTLRCVLYDEEVNAQMSPSGRPIGWVWRDASYTVTRVLGEWQAPGEVRLLRVGVRTDAGPGVAELAVAAEGRTRLRQLWT